MKIVLFVTKTLYEILLSCWKSLKKNYDLNYLRNERKPDDPVVGLL